MEEYDLQVLNYLNNESEIGWVGDKFITIKHKNGAFTLTKSQVINELISGTYGNYQSIKNKKNEKETIVTTDNSGKRSFQIRKSNQKRQIATSSGYTGNRISYRGVKAKIVKSKITGEVCSL